MSKKSKRTIFDSDNEDNDNSNFLLNQPPLKKQKIENFESQGRSWTVSVAIPGSIIQNAQTLELKTYLSGQIGRCLAIFNIDEVIIFDEPQTIDKGFDQRSKDNDKTFNPCHFLARLLQYQECPQYLRKSFFPVHKDLKLVGLLNPLDSPHHMRIGEWSDYREGIVLPNNKKNILGSYVNAGLYQNVYIKKKIKPGVRVTIKFDDNKKKGKYYHGKVVSPHLPREEKGIYWGYNTRLAKNLSSVFSQCPYKDGYDITIGTSEKGEKIEDMPNFNHFNHLLIVFGGVKGLEESVACDDTIENEDPSKLFKYYINSCYNQGSRTIRTEEAMLITLSILRPKLYNFT